MSKFKRNKNLTEKKGIFLIEDAAQSFGAEHFGNLSCSIVDISTTSFFQRNHCLVLVTAEQYFQKMKI